MERDYTLPDALPGESDTDWCRRAAGSIPPDALLRQLMAYLMRRRQRRPPWSFVSDFTGHGSGVSAAIVGRFAPPGGEGSRRD